MKMKRKHKKIKRKKIKANSGKKRKTTAKNPEERITTGIPNFDRLIGGGFDKNSINVIVGGAGSGKSIFATQFLVQGIKNGEKTLYVTFEEKKEHFYQNMSDFGWNLKEYEDKGAFTFLEYTPEKVRLMLEEGGGSIESIIKKKKISRLVIDSITSFTLLFEEELTKREAALSLFNMISKWNCTTLITLEGEHIREESIETKAVEFESDCIILIYFVRGRTERERYIEILKMRGTDHSKKIYKITIGRNGFSVATSPSSLTLEKI